ncbi:condensin-2 complex subunit H2 isoform X1 [Betta splendens]|uniref:Condensin-2 complex subunit H2 n=1 Tax=Betta splendens TaxID=158456 RepID=A0A9W2Y078_BETSP|nr:condensin-2 complex subunit H2 isoform X1 [Betta splendens]
MFLISFFFTFFLSDRQNKETAASQEDDANAAACSNNADDDEAEFIPLDINVSESSQNEDMNTTVNVDPLPPESLIPPETHEKHRLPLISAKGEILCSQKDFRINLFIPGEEDLILLSFRSAASKFHLDNDQHGDDNILQQCMDAKEFDVAENFTPLESNMEQDQEPEEHVDRHQAPRESRMVQERRQVDKPREEAPPAVNVWKFHDPYAVVGTDKPFKTGKCYKVPDGLDDGGKRKRKRPSSLQDFRSWFRGTFDPPELKLKNGPTFSDLNYIYLSTVKDKLKTRKRMYRKAGVVVSDDELRKTFLQPEEPPQQEEDDPVDGFRHADPLGGDDENSDNEHEAFADDVPAEFGGHDAEAERDELSYEDLVKLRVDQLVVNCRGYTQETALSRRVKDWEDKIRPELLLQEERPAFHIHEYGDRIVGALKSVGSRRAFSSIVHDLDNFEACKYLLASLQLANDYTVEIDSVEGLGESLDSMGLTLLSTNRATDRFKTLTATTSH